MRQGSRFAKLLVLWVMLVLPLALQAETNVIDIGPSKAVRKSLIGPQVPALPEKIHNTWYQVVAADEAGKMKTVNRLVDEMEVMMQKAGFTALEEYSLYFITRGESELEALDYETAGLYARKALKLSPGSPRIIAQSLPLVRATHTAPVFEQVMMLVKQLGSFPEMALFILKSAIYPILWGLTIGLYLLFSFLFIFRSRELLRVVANALPHKTRGYLAPLVTTLAVVIPCFFGPIWALACWAVVVLAFMKERRFLSLAVGVVIILWALLIPIRENLELWLEDKGIQTMLNVSSGMFNQTDLTVLRDLTEERPKDAVAQFTYGQLLRKYRQYDKAVLAFQRAEKLLGKQAWTKAQLGATAFLDGEIDKSEEYHSDAEKMGLESAEFYFNYSKVKFEKTDLAGSEEYLLKARRADRRVVDLLSEREKLLKYTSVYSVGDVGLPITKILASALRPMKGVGEQEKKVAKALLGFSVSSPVFMGLLSLIILIGYYIAGDPKQTRGVGSYYNTYEPSKFISTMIRVFPGAGWIVSDRPIVSLLFLIITVSLVLPVLGWPRDTTILFSSFPDVFVLYATFVSLVLLLLSFIGYYLEEQN